MSTFCGADCANCGFKAGCRGCSETGGQPFGGKCIAAAYISKCGCAAYNEFKAQLLNEVNTLLETAGVPARAQALYELPGHFVNLEYTLPGGAPVKFLDDKNIYLGCQIELEGSEMCFGVVADAGFILISSYYENGAHPALVMYKAR